MEGKEGRANLGLGRSRGKRRRLAEGKGMGAERGMIWPLRRSCGLMAKAPGPMETVVRAMMRHYHRRGVDVNRLRNDLDNLLHILHYRFVVVMLIFPIAHSFGGRFFFL